MSYSIALARADRMMSRLRRGDTRALLATIKYLELIAKKYKAPRVAWFLYSNRLRWC